MIHYYFCIISLLLLPSFAQAEDNFDYQIDSEEIATGNFVFTLSNLYSIYYDNNHKDSIQTLIEYWDSLPMPKYDAVHCMFSMYPGNSYYRGEPLERIKILDELDSKPATYFDSNINNSALVMALIQFKNRSELLKIYKKNPRAFEISYDPLREDCDHIPPDSTFDKTTEDYARSLTSKFPEGDKRKLICEVYSDMHEPLYSTMSKEEYEDSPLKEAYYDYVDSLRYGFHICAFHGSWMPQGHLSMLGNHPETGFRLGFVKRDWEYNLVFSGRYGKTKKSYPIYSKESDYYGRSFSSYFGGLDGKYIITNLNRVQLNLLFGVGIESLNIDNTGMTQNEIEDFKDSYTRPSVNIGIGLQFFVSNKVALGIDLIYHPRDFSSYDYLRTTGQAISLQFSLSRYGFMVPEFLGHNLHE